MLTRLPLPLTLDAEALQQDVEGIALEQWVPHFNRGGYAGDWSAAPLRSMGGALNRISLIQSGGEEFADTPLMAHCPAAAATLALLPCELLAVRFLRLGSHARVLEHRDGGLGFEHGEVRIHVAVSTNPGVEFRHAGSIIDMRPGEAWYLNLNLPHSVENHGESDRVHLLIDCRRNAWLERLFAQIAREELARTMARDGATIWLTGRAGSGRSVLAKELAKRMALLGQPVSIVDDDFADHDLAAAMALAAAQRGELAVVGIPCPSAKDRECVRAHHERAALRFMEVFIDCQREICDVRVHLRNERGGARRTEPSSRAEFEPGPAPEVIVHSDRETVGEEAEIVLTSLVHRDPPTRAGR